MFRQDNSREKSAEILLVVKQPIRFQQAFSLLLSQGNIGFSRAVIGILRVLYLLADATFYSVDVIAANKNPTI